MPHIQLHHHHHGSDSREIRGIPKGFLAVTVGQDAEQQRFVIPVTYVNHPLFSQLLKEAEEEYGFDQKGPIRIPCLVEEFRHVSGLIDRETTSHHPHHFLCFKA